MITIYTYIYIIYIYIYIHIYTYIHLYIWFDVRMRYFGSVSLSDVWNASHAALRGSCSWWCSAVKLNAVLLSGVYSDLHGVHPGLVSVRGRVHVVSLGFPRAQPHQHLHAALRQIRQLLQPSDLLRPELQVPARRERAAALRRRRRDQRRRQAQALQEDQGQGGRPEIQSRGEPPNTQEPEKTASGKPRPLPRLRCGSPGDSAPCR